jgi:hypothetical protein
VVTKLADSFVDGGAGWIWLTSGLSHRFRQHGRIRFVNNDVDLLTRLARPYDLVEKIDEFVTDMTNCRFACTLPDFTSKAV